MSAPGLTVPVAGAPAVHASHRRETFGDASSAGRLFSSLHGSGMKPAMDRQASVSRGLDSARLARMMSCVAAGEAGSLKTLYDKTSAKLYGICLRVLHDEAEAQDVLQEVYLVVWRNADRFDAARASPITWLATIARNRAIDRLRSKNLLSGDIVEALDIADDSPSSLDVLEQAEDSSRLRRCLDELDERARTMIRCAFFDGLTYAALAERERVPLPTMKSWIRRGLQRLRVCLEQ